MKRVWPLIYLVLLGFSIAAGAGVFPHNSSPTNADWVFVSISFILGFISPLGAVAFARSRSIVPFQRPSFSRGFRGGWRSDPLQWLRISVLLLAGHFVGELFTLPVAQAQSAMLIWWHAAMLLGLALGERAVYAVFRSNIA